MPLAMDMQSRSISPSVARKPTNSHCGFTPRSELLQSALDEEKAESQRRRILRRSDNSQDNGIVDSSVKVNDERNRVSPELQDHSPAFVPDQRGSTNSRRASAYAVASARTETKRMSARNLDEHFDKVKKQNFDLKLKIAMLEAKLETAKLLGQQNAELQEGNEQLRAELKKTKQAVKEAVEIICVLEEKVEMMEAASDATRLSVAPQTSTYVPSDEGATFLSSPNHWAWTVKAAAQEPGVIAATPPRRTELTTPRKFVKKSDAMPSFMANRNSSAVALRSLYLDSYKGLQPKPGFISAVTGQDDESVNADEAMRTPCLSDVSETSFRSVYAKDPPLLSRMAKDARRVQELSSSSSPEPRIPLSPQSTMMARVNQWVGERVITSVESKKSRQSFVHSRKWPEMSEDDSNGHGPNNSALIGLGDPQTSNLRYAIKSRAMRDNATTSSLTPADWVAPQPPLTPETVSTLVLNRYSSSPSTTDPYLLGGMREHVRSFSHSSPTTETRSHDGPTSTATKELGTPPQRKGSNEQPVQSMTPQQPNTTRSDQMHLGIGGTPVGEARTDSASGHLPRRQVRRSPGIALPKISQPTFDGIGESKRDGSPNSRLCSRSPPSSTLHLSHTTTRVSQPFRQIDQTIRPNSTPSPSIDGHCFLCPGSTSSKRSVSLREKGRLYQDGFSSMNPIANVNSRVVPSPEKLISLSSDEWPLLRESGQPHPTHQPSLLRTNSHRRCKSSSITHSHHHDNLAIVHEHNSTTSQSLPKGTSPPSTKSTRNDYSLATTSKPEAPSSGSHSSTSPLLHRRLETEQATPSKLAIRHGQSTRTAYGVPGAGSTLDGTLDRVGSTKSRRKWSWSAARDRLSRSISVSKG